MTYQTMLELTGYFASILILVSLLMSSAVKLRVLNAVGAAVFTVYGILIGSYPTAFLNGVSVIVDIYYIVKLLNSRVSFIAHQVPATERGLEEFLRFYRNDIGHHFPTYDFRIEEDDLVFLVYTEANPVGIMVAHRQDEKTLLVKLDYSIPKFRDCSVGKFLYAELAQNGISRLITSSGTQDHNAYLARMGFREEDGRFTKYL